MKVTVLCSDERHSKWPGLADWVAARRSGTTELVTRVGQAQGGDILFLISCSEMVRADVQARYRNTLVIHASSLPQGRGWSPHVWAILEGRNRICVTLLEAAEKVDAGAIWAQREVALEGHELWDEIAAAIGAAEFELMEWAIAMAETVVPQPQTEDGATYYRRRAPADGELDVNCSIAAQFDLLRVSDPYRYPAFFDYRGHRYAVRIEKQDKENA